MGSEPNWVIPPSWAGPAVVKAVLAICMRLDGTAETIDPVWSAHSNRCLDVQGIRRDADVAGRIPAVWGGPAVVEAVLAIVMRSDGTVEAIDPV